jgi:lipopolysaccharide-binding protein
MGVCLAVNVPIKGIGALDYRLTSAPKFSKGFIEAGVKVCQLCPMADH